MRSVLILSTLVALSLPRASAAQAGTAAPASTTDAIRDEMLMHFESSMSRVIALAEAMPAERYRWAPDSGVMPVAQVYAHIARFNYEYPASRLGVAVPSGIALDTVERMTDKAQVVALLRHSLEHVRANVGPMSEAQLQRPTRLYGRDVPGWAVLIQLVAHMNEHLGQSIAYARSNGVVPPWSQ